MCCLLENNGTLLVMKLRSACILLTETKVSCSLPESMEQAELNIYIYIYIL